MHVDADVDAMERGKRAAMTARQLNIDVAPLSPFQPLLIRQVYLRLIWCEGRRMVLAWGVKE